MLDKQDVKGRLVTLCRELLDIPSVTGQEKAVTDHLETWARNLRLPTDFSVLRQDNALVVGQPDGDRPCIALVGHTDTVPPVGEFSPSVLEGDRLIGLGASDMKSGIAVMQALFETCDLTQLPFCVMLVLYDREEGPYGENGLQPMLETCDMLRDIDLAVAMEPTDNTLQLGCMGGVHARITFRGRAAHSARPWQGVNAIHNAGPFLTALRDRPCPEVSVEGLVFREAASITMAQGGRTRNVVPDTFELNLNYRFAPAPPLETCVARVEEEIRRMAGDATVQITDISPPGPVPTSSPILAHWRAVVPMEVLPKQAWTDVARLAAFGIDAINFGPGMGAQAHQPGEWVSVNDMVHAFDILARVLKIPLAL